MITHEILEKKSVIKVSVNMDAVIANNLKANFNELLNDLQQQVVLDLSNVEYIDSSGIGVLVYFYKKLTCKDRTLMIINVLEQPMELFSLLRLNKIIDIETKRQL